MTTRTTSRSSHPQRRRRPGSAALLLAALLAAPLDAADAPGLGNVDWSTGGKSVWDTVAMVDSAAGTPRGHGTVAMLNGYLVVVFSNDGGGGGGSGGFALLDVSDPAATRTVFTTQGNPAYASGTDQYAGDIREAHGIAFRGDVMVLGTNKGSGTGLQFWDLSTPTTDPAGNDPASASGPTRVGSLDLGLSGGDYDNTPWWLSWQGRYLYVSAAGSGLFIIDAADPSAPVLADRGGAPNPIPTSELGEFRFNQVLTVGNLLVGANVDLNNGIMVADISDPLHPVKRWSTTTASVGYSFIINDGKILGAHDPARYWDISGWASSSWTGPGSAVLLDGTGGRGGYGTCQDGVFHVGKSNGIGKVDIASGAGLGFVTPKNLSGGSIGSADWDFNVVLGNLSFAGNDHSSGSALVIHQLAPDTTPPEVTMVVPADGASNQATSSRIGLTFSDQILVETVDSASIVIREQGGPAIAGSYAVQTGIVNFSPAAPLKAGTTYRIEVLAEGVEDLVGNAVATTLVSTFTTAGASTPLLCDLDQQPAAVTGATVSFAGDASGGSGPLAYRWDFGDGTVLDYDAGASVNHSYAGPGHYSVTMTVRDGVDTTTSCTVTQVVHRPLTAQAPRRSGTMAYDPGRDRVYVVNPDNDTVTAVRTTGTPNKQWEVAVGDHPRSIAQAADGNLWVVNQDDASLSIVDPDDRSVRTLALPHGTDPYGIAMNPAGTVAYVTLQVSAVDPLQASGRLLKIDATSPQSLVVLGATALPAHPRGLAVSADGTRVLVTRFHSPADHGEVHEIATASMTLLRTITLAMDPGLGGAEPDDEANGRGVPNYLQGIAISPDGQRAWVPSKKDNVVRGRHNENRDLGFDSTVRTIVTPLDLGTGQELLGQRLDFNDSDLANAVLFSPLGDYAFVSLQGNHRIEVVDAYSNAPVHTIDSAGLAPQGLVLSDEGRLFVHNFLSRSVAVFDVGSILDSSDSTTTPVGSPVALVASEQLPAEVLAGKRIFHDADDPRMNRDGYLSCATCHLEGGADQRVWDFTQRGEGHRNTIDLRGRRGATRGAVHWTGNFDEIQDFENDIRTQFGGDGFLPQADWDDAQVRDPLGTAKAGRSVELDRLAAYVDSLDQVGTSPFRAAPGVFTSAALAGRAAFTKAGCQTCHGGPDFSDSLQGLRHDVGTATAASGQRIGATLDGFDTPGLRGLWRTAPYLHDGSAANLLVLLDNAAHGAPGLLSVQERQDLVAYLLQIDDESTAPNAPPLITSGASADPDPVTGTGTTLAVAATDPDGTVLGYSWTCTAHPGPLPSIAAPTQATTTVTFLQAGNHTFEVSVSDGSASVTSSVTVTVQQTPSGIGVQSE